MYVFLPQTLQGQTNHPVSAAITDDSYLSQRPIVISSKNVYSDVLKPILLLWIISIPSSFSDSPFFRATWTRGSQAVTAPATVTEALCAEIKEEKATYVRFSYEKQNNQQNLPFCHRSTSPTVDCCIRAEAGRAPAGSGGPTDMNYPRSAATWHDRRQRKWKINGRKKRSEKKDGIVHKQITHPSHLLVPQYKTERMCLTFKCALEEERWVGR